MTRRRPRRQRQITVARGTIGLLAVVLVAARPVGAAVSLSSLGGASVQTLIDLGGDGVTVGTARYFDFTYVATPTAPVASAVHVQGATGGGLKFVASWVAANGSSQSTTVGYDVAPVDPANDAITQITLLSNGTAPAPDDGTFVTTTAWATTATGTLAAPVLSTYDDGPSTPTHPTFPDTDSQAVFLPVPQSALSVTDTLTAVSGPGGVATASVLQNGVAVLPTTAVTVPEPATLTVTAVSVVGLTRCRRRRPRRLP